jgi:hypothetical protein
MTSSRPLLVGLLLVAAGLVFVASRPTRAEDSTGYDLRYLSITGEGSPAWRPSGTVAVAGNESGYTLLLERKR